METLAYRTLYEGGEPRKEEALHNLRLLGSDAVHVEARVYADVGKRQVEVAVDVVKTILQAIYQMDTIFGELESLKASAGETEAAH